MASSNFFFATILLVAVSFNFAQGETNRNSKNVSIVIMGRSGTGISSTTTQILGLDNEITEEIPGAAATMVKEYSIPISGLAGSFLKIIDVQGLVDGKSLEHDSQVLAALKAYLSDPTGLDGTQPNFFLVVSNFDDSNFSTRQSEFIQLVKRVELLQQNVYGNGTLPSSTVFLLTKLLSESRANQKHPEDKINLFVNTIRNSSLIPEPINVIVGDNAGKQLPTGYIKLPNSETYPKNVFDRMISLAQSCGDDLAVSVVTNVRDSRTVVKEISSRQYSTPLQSASQQELLTLIRELKYDVASARGPRDMATMLENWSGSVKQFCDDFYQLHRARSGNRPEL